MHFPVYLLKYNVAVTFIEETNTPMYCEEHSSFVNINMHKENLVYLLLLC